MCAGVWGVFCLCTVMLGRYQVVLWAPMGSAALGCLPTKPPCSQVTALKANAGQASCLLSPGV